MNAFITAIKRAVRTPSAHELAVQELQEAHRQLLAAESGREWADSMVSYHQARIARLTERLEGGMACATPTP